MALSPTEGRCPLWIGGPLLFDIYDAGVGEGVQTHTNMENTPVFEEGSLVDAAVDRACLAVLGGLRPATAELDGLLQGLQEDAGEKDFIMTHLDVQDPLPVYPVFVDLARRRLAAASALSLLRSAADAADEAST